MYDKIKKCVNVDYNTIMTALFCGIVSLALKIKNVKKDLER